MEGFRITQTFCSMESPTRLRREPPLPPLAFGHLPTPFVPSGHFPLRGGIGPLIRGVGPGGVLPNPSLLPAKRSKGTNAVFAARRKRSGVDFATTSRHGQSNSPPGSGAIRKETYLWRRNRETPQRRAESSRPTEGAKTKMGAAGASPRPTGFKKTFWDWVGEAPLGLPPGFAPVPLARQTQARKRNRTGGNFCKPRAQWPGGNLECHLDFARRK